MSESKDESGSNDPALPRPKGITIRPLTRPPSISPEQLQQILQLNRAGNLGTAISKQLGVPRTTIARALDFLAQDPTNGITDYKTQQRELDTKILSLNKQGLSSRRIAKQLGTNKKRILDRLNFLSKNPSNGIIDNSIGPREESKWYQIIQYINDVLLPHYKSRGIKPSLRTIFYRLEADGYIEKTDNAYKSLVQHTVQARVGEEGSQGELLYPQLPIDCFADETRGFEPDYDNAEPSEMIPPGKILNPERFIEDAINELKITPGYYDGVGTEGTNGTMCGMWYNQPEYVEVWIEKFALKPTFEKFLEDKNVNLVVNKGYSSLSFLWKNCRRIKEKVDEFGEENVHVLYFGDLDPSGENMDNAYKRYFERWNISPDVFKRISITPEQIENYNIPTRPVKTKPRPGKKRIDPRTKGFVKRYGKVATELDAFLAVNEDAFEELVHQSVDDHWRQDIYDALEKEYDVEAGPPPKLNNEQLTTFREEMYQKINEAFYEGWDQSYKEYDQENLDPDNNGEPADDEDINEYNEN